MDDPKRQLPWGEAIAVELPPGAPFLPQERWAWARIIRGERADMRFFPKDAAAQAAGANGDDDGGGDDPKAAEKWPGHRDLSALFLRTILFHEPWANARARPFVRIRCARFGEALDWENESFAGEIELSRSLFKRDVVWRGLTVGKLFDLQGSRLEGALRADGLVVEGDLFCREGFSAKGDIRLLGARVGGNAEFDGATLEGALRADRLVVEGGLFLRDIKKLNAANLFGAHVGQDLQLCGSTIEGRVALTGAEIKGELNLAQSHGGGPKWGEKAHLVLRNAKAGALAGGLDAFRRGKKDFVRCDLAGFAYARIGDLGAGATGSTLAQADSKQLRRWLQACCPPKDGFEPGPHRTLAHALAAAGYPSKAADIRNELGNHELAARGVKFSRRLVLWLSSLLIGYGERNHRAFFLFMLLVSAAAMVGYWQDLISLPAASPAGWFDLRAWLDWAGFAFGNSIPLVVLDPAHATFLPDRFCIEPGELQCAQPDIPFGLVGFFYSAKIVGFIILSYLAAGLTGIAQRKD